MATAVKASPRKAPAKKAPAKKAVAKKATAKKRRPMSAENRAKLAKNLEKARATRAANATARREGRPVATKRTATRVSENGDMSAYQRNKIIREYLESIRGANGDDVRRVSLKGIESMSKGFSVDPDEIERAIPVLESTLSSIHDPLKRLKTLKRLRVMREAVANLRDEGPKAGFIKIGKEWCAENGYDYAIMRDAGVPAAVLKEAGIE